jgi:hypothetical protein
MAIQKGQVLNPTGRPKGAINKDTRRVKESIQLVMDALETTLLEDIARVTPQRRLQLYTDLMQYIKPKLSTTKADIDIQSDSKLEFVIRYENALDKAKDNNIIEI